jgi:glycosyltransferase involved in cell wall biosynthesis
MESAFLGVPWGGLNSKRFSMYQLKTFSKGQISGGEEFSVRPGALDGVTIMRYAHLYRNRASGGVDQYLRHLDKGLLQRHRMTVLQTHLIKDGTDHATEVDHVGVGRIVWLPVPIRQTHSALGDLPARIGYIWKRTLRMGQREGKGQYRAMFSSVQALLRHQGGHLRHKAAVLSDHLPHLLQVHNVDLLALHWLTYDTNALILRALESRVPFVLISHFDNARLSLPEMRKWITLAAGIGTVSDQGIPDDLRHRCVNLSDAVDTEFFTPEKARPVQLPACPIVLLPGRIIDGKGHHDLIQAASILLARGVDLVACFAGAVDSEPLHQELRRSAAAKGLEGRMLFLGEISPEELRGWYARSSMVVLPSYSEGLPRVVLEAQAMKKPVVAYNCGGTSKSLLPNETGFLVERGEVEALADKISFILKDEAQRLRMGERGREFVCRQFSISALIQRHEAFYLRALSRARSE